MSGAAGHKTAASWRARGTAAAISRARSGPAVTLRGTGDRAHDPARRHGLAADEMRQDLFPRAAAGPQ
jgi:hypothetical protein